MMNVSVADQLGRALIASNLASLVEAAPAPVAAPGLAIVDRTPPANDEKPWPRTLEFAQPFGPNVKVLADAPLNWQWMPSMQLIMYGQQGRILADPSNGKELGLPTRSPAGFPLFYAKAPDGKGGSVAIGTASVLYGNDSLNSDAEVFDLISRERAAATAPRAVGQTTWADVGERIAQQGTAAIPATPSDGEVPVKIEP